MTRREAIEEITRDLRSTGKYTEPQIRAQTDQLKLLTAREIGAFMLLYRHNRDTIPR